jgi:tight adherence protein B
MNLIFFLQIFLGACLIALFVWGLYRLMIDRFGTRNQLLKQRIESLSLQKQSETLITPLFKEPIFSTNAEFNNVLKNIPLVHSIDRMIASSGGNFTVHQYINVTIILFIASMATMGVLTKSFTTGLWGGFLSAAVPFMYLKVKNAQRRSTLEKQLPDLLDYIGRALSAGHSFNSALQAAASQSPDPIGAEFKATFDQLNFGVAVKDAMNDLVKRVDNQDIRFFAIAVVLNREVGGNLAELLNEVASLIRQRLTTKLIINTLTAEGKATAKFLGFLPIVAIVALSLMLPGYFDPVLESDTGIHLFMGTAAWAGMGFLWMRSISNIKL